MFSTCNVGGLSYKQRQELRQQWSALQIQAVAFDFDGVIVDSTPIKDGAVLHLVREFNQEQQDQAWKVWMKNKGVFRPERIDRVFQEALGISLDALALEAKVREFVDAVFAKTVAAPFIPGILTYLQSWPLIPSYIVSAGPQDEVRDICQRRDIKRYFRDIFGGPEKKAPILSQIIEREACQPRELLFIGDSLPDYRAAEAVGAVFLGVVGPGLDNPFPEVVRPVTDLTQLAEIVQGWWRVVS